MTHYHSTDSENDFLFLQSLFFLLSPCRFLVAFFNKMHQCRSEFRGAHPQRSMTRKIGSGKAKTNVKRRVGETGARCNNFAFELRNFLSKENKPKQNITFGSPFS